VPDLVGSWIMTVARLNGIALNYEVAGSGDLVVLVMGTGSSGRVWKLHQVPALLAAGYRVLPTTPGGSAQTL
jgi:pimeloyl-ACP methyl ester carboxylesterase